MDDDLRRMVNEKLKQMDRKVKQIHKQLDERGMRIAVVCTKRGQHRAARLTTFSVTDRSWSGDANSSFANPDADAPPALPGGEVNVSRGAYVFACPDCGRTPQFAVLKWRRHLLEHRRAGCRTIDISLLES